MSHRLRWALIALILLAWGLRLYRLEAQSLWYDEAVTADVVQLGLERLTRWTANDIQPPFYYYLLAGWVGLAGSGEWALRFPSALFGLLAVPLAYALGRRLFARGGEWGRRAAFLAALFACLSPLYVYYAQEARMYALLTALGLLMAVFLVDWLHTPLRQEQRRDRWLAMIAVSIAAVYTHYYAFFLILAFALYFLAVWSRRRPRLVGAEALIALVSIGVAYFPWFPFVANRYQADASYWRGTLKLGEALRHTFINFTLGETVLEPVAVKLLWGFGLILVISVAALLWQGTSPAAPANPPPAKDSRTGRRRDGPLGRRRDEPPARLYQQRGRAVARPRVRPTFRIPFNLLFLLCYLVIPVIAILAFSYRNPKFNPRYLMLASPALLLLLAGGIARLTALWTGERRNEKGEDADKELATGATSPLTPALSPMGRGGVRSSTLSPKGRGKGEGRTYSSNRPIIDIPILVGERRGSGGGERLWAFLPAALCILFIGAAFLYADYNLYADSRFTKPDFRGAVAYVQASRRPDEAVLLVSGHLSPAWDYYAPQSERTRLPDMDILDTNRVLGYAVAADLEGAMEGKNGAWLVLWQDDVIDPLGVVDELLTRASTEPPQERRFWHVRVRHYPTIPPSQEPRFRPEPPIAQESYVNFGGALALVGFSQEANGGLTLYWQALRPLTEDFKVTLSLVDEAGLVWGRAADRRPAAYGYPTFRWRPGETIPGRYEAIPADPGTPPGDYRLEIGVYEETTARALDVLDAAGAPQGQRAKVGLLRLERPMAVPDEGALPMQQRLNVPLNENVELVGYSLDRTEGEPGDLLHLDLWLRTRQGEGEPHNLWLVWSSPNGALADANLHPVSLIGVGPRGSIVRAQAFVPIYRQATPGPWQLRLALTRGIESRIPGAWTALATIQVRPTTRNFTVPRVQRPSGASFAGQATLVGADLSTEATRPGAAVSITVTWQAGEPATRDYTAFVHLLGPDGKVAAGEDAPPGGDARPTTSWVTGEVLSRRYDLTLPRDAAPGDYALEVGLYDAQKPGLPRLSATSPQGEALGDRVLLGTVRVE
ncbi:MAG: glycosyltransferase family 39 protein [Anaerolineae bacterium]|nr:glycosyltransferase family 39 protein [Anaerolineae bacterium]